MAGAWYKPHKEGRQVAGEPLQAGDTVLRPIVHESLWISGSDTPQGLAIGGWMRLATKEIWLGNSTEPEHRVPITRPNRSILLGMAAEAVAVAVLSAVVVVSQWTRQ